MILGIESEHFPNINWLVFVMETQSASCEVENKFLNIIYMDFMVHLDLTSGRYANQNAIHLSCSFSQTTRPTKTTSLIQRQL
jgi:hypothetical protein